MNHTRVELHFIDGPLQGTRKLEDVSIIQRNRVYRYLQPPTWDPEQLVSTNTNHNAVRVTCIEWDYLPFPLPKSYNGLQRYAMCLEKGLN